MESSLQKNSVIKFNLLVLTVQRSMKVMNFSHILYLVANIHRYSRCNTGQSVTDTWPRGWTR